MLYRPGGAEAGDAAVAAGSAGGARRYAGARAFVGGNLCWAGRMHDGGAGKGPDAAAGELLVITRGRAARECQPAQFPLERGRCVGLGFEEPVHFDPPETDMGGVIAFVVSYEPVLAAGEKRTAALLLAAAYESGADAAVLKWAPRGETAAICRRAAFRPRAGKRWPVSGRKRNCRYQGLLNKTNKTPVGGSKRRRAFSVYGERMHAGNPGGFRRGGAVHRLFCFSF